MFRRKSESFYTYVFGRFARKKRILILLLIIIWIFFIKKVIESDDSVPVPHDKKIHETVRAPHDPDLVVHYTTKIPEVKKIPLPEVNSKPNRDLLKLWRKLYLTQRENLHFIIGRRFSSPDVVRSISLLNSSSREVNDLIDMNLFQLLNLEELRRHTEDIAMGDELAKYVVSVIEFNQNPPGCKVPSALYCTLGVGCGFACQFHNILYCLTTALAKGKVVIASESGWRGFDSYTDLFLPLSSTCDQETLNKNNIEIESVPYIESTSSKSFTPTAVPSQILDKILAFHSNPFLWWIGQLIKYVLRYQPETLKNIMSDKITIEHPIVGIHIRRTDKIGTEADMYDHKEYMFWAELYFRKLEISGQKYKRRIYLATDEIGLSETIKKEYPNYQVITNEDATASANYERSSQNGTYGILADINYLSQTDYVVCTFSSQVCRLAYEIMNSRLPDASENYHSLDEIFYFGGQKQRDFNLHIPHKADDDTIIDTSRKFNHRHNDWNGYSLIHFLGSKSSVQYHIPTYKIQENWMHADFSAFDNYEKHKNKV